MMQQLVTARDERHVARRFLPEIQALRMWAVGLVVLFHLSPTGFFSGGYVGVDAFFVISGFLITAHLLREVEETGRVRLGAFYARRARRLLPASLLVLVVSVPLMLWLLPVGVWAQSAHEVMASAFYVQNLWLAGKSVTYSGADDVASPVQHYWSLSVEEQFYLVWPALILIALWAARRIRRARVESVILAFLSAVGVTSLVISLVLTPAHPSFSYFITPTRAWEFAAGGLIPFVFQRWSPGFGASMLLRYGGLCLLIGSAVEFSQATPFPGWAALLPVTATAAVIIAGDANGRDPLAILFTNGVTQWLGNISYSIYLWHWPLIALAPYVIHDDLGFLSKLVIVVLALVLGQLSKRYVEDATRCWPRIRASTGRTLLSALVGMIVVTALSLLMTGLAPARERAVEQLREQSAKSACFGATAVGKEGCGNPYTKSALFQVTEQEAPWGSVAGCSSFNKGLICDFSNGHPSTSIAVVGDSHAGQYRRDFVDLARAKHWKVYVWSTNACVPTYALSPVYKNRPRDPAFCVTQTKLISGYLAKVKPTFVVTTGFTAASQYESSAAAIAGFDAVWRDWQKHSKVIVIRDQPVTEGVNMPQCLAQRAGYGRACTTPTSAALVWNPMVQAAEASDGRVPVIDFTHVFCDEKLCYSVIGGVPVYYDLDHLSRTFAGTLSSRLDEQLTALLPRG